MPRYLLQPIPGERDLGVDVVVESLKCIRGRSRQGAFSLRKECIRRAYQLVERPSMEPAPLDETTLFLEPPGETTDSLEMETLNDCGRYCEIVKALRRTLKPGYVLLYHYTDPRFIKVKL